MDNSRKEFLMHMYDQMFNDINRHIMVIWQSIAVLIGAFALFSLVEKGIISVDLAVSFIIVIIFWLFAMIYDSSYWYNRNLVIIANIERQFLSQNDLKEIHYYFGKHRKSNSLLRHLMIQMLFGFMIGIVIIIYHISVRIIIAIENYNMNKTIYMDDLLKMSLPYLLILIGVPFLYNFKKQREKAYEEFIKNSPGKKIDTTGIEYGVGHPTSETEN